MNWLKQIVRIGLTKCANKQRRALLRTRCLAPVQSKLQTVRQPFVDNSLHFAYPLHNFDISTILIKETQKRMAQSHGLSDLVAKKTSCDGNMDLGDFAAVSQENFTHALHFSKAEIDYGNFNIDEIETVCSQSVHEKSVAVKNNKERENIYFEESDGSERSYTETDIYIELPSSEVIEKEREKLGNTSNDSAPF
jgi:hypothetical protein